MAQQLIEKVELRGEGELLKIQQLLEEAVDRRLQDGVARQELSEAGQQELRAASADFVAQLRQLVVFADEEAAEVTTRTQLTPAAASLALRSPLLKPLSPPPVDSEVQQLEQQVTEASLRVAELRTSMRAKLQEQLAAKLAACRPTAELEPGAGAVNQQQAGAGAAGAEPSAALASSVEEARRQGVEAAAGEQQAAEQQAAEQQVQPDSQPAQPMDSDNAAQQPEAAAAADEMPAIPLSPQPMELQQRLLQAANRMPALRARLEQASDRLQRVVAAVTADINRPPPNTVEKAVLGKTPGKPLAAVTAEEENVPGVSPLFKQALESGQISTRRRVARDVQPVPYSQPE